jgi:hypothetical protein
MALEIVKIKRPLNAGQHARRTTTKAPSGGALNQKIDFFLTNRVR